MLRFLILLWPPIVLCPVLCRLLLLLRIRDVLREGPPLLMVAVVGEEGTARATKRLMSGERERGRPSGLEECSLGSSKYFHVRPSDRQTVNEPRFSLDAAAKCDFPRGERGQQPGVWRANGRRGEKGGKAREQRMMEDGDQRQKGIIYCSERKGRKQCQTIALRTKDCAVFLLTLLCVEKKFSLAPRVCTVSMPPFAVYVTFSLLIRTCPPSPPFSIVHRGERERERCGWRRDPPSSFVTREHL